jgi:hypothetical protein
MKSAALLIAAGLLVAVSTGCRAKQEYSCGVTLNTSSGSVTLAQDTTSEWYASSLGSVFGAYETTAARAQAQCVDMVRGRLSSVLTQQYPDGVVRCSCVTVDGY